MAISRRNMMRASSGAGVASPAAEPRASQRSRPEPGGPCRRPRGATTAMASPRRALTEGPFYTPNTPKRRVLREPGTVGTPLVIEGRVLAADCRPIAGAVLDFWSCDGNGVYDNEGFRLRGHQFTDQAGRFRVETVKPKDYRQFGFRRTPHVHVKVQGPGTPCSPPSSSSAASR